MLNLRHLTRYVRSDTYIHFFQRAEQSTGSSRSAFEYPGCRRTIGSVDQLPCISAGLSHAVACLKSKYSISCTLLQNHSDAGRISCGLLRNSKVLYSRSVRSYCNLTSPHRVRKLSIADTNQEQDEADKTVNESYSPLLTAHEISSTFSLHGKNDLLNAKTASESNGLNDSSSRARATRLETAKLEPDNRVIADNNISKTLELTDVEKSGVSSEKTTSKRSLETDSSCKVRDVEEKPENMGIFKRFHHTYKQYGKVVVVVHCATSTIWSAMFYYVAMSGVDVEPALRWLGAGDTIVSFYTMPGVGNAAVAYLFYKLATPIRYPVTIAGTHLAVKYLRKWGYMPPVAQENTLRSLMSEGRTQMKSKYQHYHHHIGDIRNEYKDRIKKLDDWSQIKK